MTAPAIKSAALGQVRGTVALLMAVMRLQFKRRSGEAEAKSLLKNQTNIEELDIQGPNVYIFGNEGRT